MEMFSLQIKFVTDGQTYRRTTVKQYAPNLSMMGHNKNYHSLDSL